MGEEFTELHDSEKIRQKIKDIHGQEIKYAKQCKELSQSIKDKTGRLVSTATLRRFFHLMKSSSNPSRYTLETLTLFIETENNKSKIDQSNFDDFEQTKDYCDALISNSKSNFQIVDELLNQNYTRVSLNPKLRYILDFAVQNENTDLILSFYQNQKALTAQTDFYKTFGAILNAKPEKSLKILSRLAENEVVRLNFYENFVNTGNFKVYQHWLKYYKDNEVNVQKKLWADAVLIWGDLLSKKEVKWHGFIDSFHKVFNAKNDPHPMLKARVYGVALFCPELKEDAKYQLFILLRNERRQFKIDPTFTPFASLLITQYLLLADEKELLNQVDENLSQPTFSTEYMVKSIPFFTKLINAYLDNKDIFEFDEVLMLQSGFTNEDYLLKAFALKFLNERDEESIADYIESIIVNNDFILLEDISQRNVKETRTLLNFG